MTTATRKSRSPSRSRARQTFSVDEAYIAAARTAWWLQQTMRDQPGKPLADALDELLRHHGWSRRQVTLRSRDIEKRLVASLLAGVMTRAG